jgi:hypothetical protein
MLREASTRTAPPALRFDDGAPGRAHGGVLCSHEQPVRLEAHLGGLAVGALAAPARSALAAALQPE